MARKNIYVEKTQDTGRDILMRIREFLEDYDLMDKPVDIYGNIESDVKVSDNRHRATSMDLSSGVIRKYEELIIMPKTE